MRAIMIAVLVALPLLASAEEPALEAPIQPNTAKHLAPMGWIIGQWTGSGTMNGQAVQLTVEHGWKFGRNLIRTSSRWTIGGKPAWSDVGYMGWDRANKRLVWFMFGMDGTIGQGHFAKTKDKNVWMSFGKIGGEGGVTHETRTFLRRTGDDAYEFESQAKQGDKWVTNATIKHTRVKTPPVKKPAVPPVNKKPTSGR